MPPPAGFLADDPSLVTRVGVEVAFEVVVAVEPEVEPEEGEGERLEAKAMPKGTLSCAFLPPE
jgi:hypothetical protein